MEKKTRTPRPPRTLDGVLAVAKRLKLKERVDLINALSAYNKSEAVALVQAAKEAAELVR